MSEGSIGMTDFLPELFGVLVGTVIGYLIANRASKLASKKNINQTKNALVEEVQHNKKAIKSWTERGTSFQYHLSTLFRKSAYQTAIASGNFTKLEHDLQQDLGELYHEINAFESFANIIVNWHYATIALNPQNKEDYEKLLENLSDSTEFVHFEEKLDDLLKKVQDNLTSM